MDLGVGPSVQGNTMPVRVSMGWLVDRERHVLREELGKGLDQQRVELHPAVAAQLNGPTHMRLDAQGHIDSDLWCMDGSTIRATRAAAGAGKKGAPKSPKTTFWAARAADSAASST